METKFYTGISTAQDPHTPIYMSQNAPQGIRRQCNPATYFVNETLDICRQIIDPSGEIRNFPGIEADPYLIAACPYYRKLPPILRYDARFSEVRDGKIQMVWTLREEYWDPGDEWGFGTEEEPAVELHTFLDERGNFTSPFRLYAIGKTVYADL